MNYIYKRRSIRSYNSQIISNEDMLALIKAGMNAPSAKCSRTSEFIIVDKKQIMSELSIVNPFMFMLEKCNKAIVVIGTETTEYWQQDLAASTQNILLEATKMNIASCWIGIAPIISYEQKVREILKINNKYRVLSIVSLGYTDKDKEENIFFDISKIYYNNEGV